MHEALVNRLVRLAQEKSVNWPSQHDHSCCWLDIKPQPKQIKHAANAQFWYRGYLKYTHPEHPHFSTTALLAFITSPEGPGHDHAWKIKFDLYIQTTKNLIPEKWTVNKSADVLIGNQVYLTKQISKACQLSNFRHNMTEKLLAGTYTINSNNQTCIHSREIT